ncbi:MAG: glutathione synthase, partial [Deltaproteobacteria bacterium]|nr:glutathione synthase [Deltaproteobacteria bacterium]
GLDFVGLDVIGAKLTEVNVTSPMGLAEIQAVSGQALQSQVIDFIEKKI